MFSQTYSFLVHLLLAGYILLSSPSWAQDDLSNLPDPTRPDLGFQGSSGKKVGDLIDGLIGATDEASTKALPPLLLQYTLISPKRRLAVINGEMVEEGAIIAEAKIIKIRPEQVVAQRLGEQIILDLARYQAKNRESESGAEQAAEGDNDVSK